MSSGSRFRTLLVVLGAILAAGSVQAQAPVAPPSGTDAKSSRDAKSSGDVKSSGKWTDPPARAEPAPAGVASKPVAMPAKVDDAAAPSRAESRPPRRSAKLRREQIRRTASRGQVVRQVRSRAPKVASRPARRVALRASPREATPRQQPTRLVRTGPSQGWRPVYGYIEPDAPAEAYYERRRFGGVGVSPGELGLHGGEGRIGRPVGGRLVMRWRGAAVPAGFATGAPSPFDGDEE